jgi:hypothetical protein
MDGSAKLWLSVIRSAQKDFLKLHSDPRRISEWDDLFVWDLLDGDYSILPGREDAWNYITARDFLFDDDYKIDFGSPGDEAYKAISCKELLEFLEEIYSGKQCNTSFVSLSINHLRSFVANESNDPDLIEEYSIID